MRGQIGKQDEARKTAMAETLKKQINEAKKKNIILKDVLERNQGNFMPFSSEPLAMS